MPLQGLAVTCGGVSDLALRLCVRVCALRSVSALLELAAFWLARVLLGLGRLPCLSLSSPSRRTLGPVCRVLRPLCLSSCLLCDLQPKCALFLLSAL